MVKSSKRKGCFIKVALDLFCTKKKQRYLCLDVRNHYYLWVVKYTHALHLSNTEGVIYKFLGIYKDACSENVTVEWHIGESLKRWFSFAVLPMEVLMYIFRWVVSSDLDLRSLEQLSQVCRGFYICARYFCFKTTQAVVKKGILVFVNFDKRTWWVFWVKG